MFASHVSLGGTFPFSTTPWTFHFESGLKLANNNAVSFFAHFANEPGFLFLVGKLQNQFYSKSQASLRKVCEFIYFLSDFVVPYNEFMNETA